MSVVSGMGVSGVIENVNTRHAGNRARLMVCDARPLVRLGLSCAFSQDPDFVVAGEAVTSDGVAELVSRLEPELVLIHTRVPPAGCLLVIPELRKRFSNLRVLGLADTLEPLIVAELLRVGATGIAHVSQSAVAIVEAARATLRGTRYLSPSFDIELIHSTLRDSPLQTLTMREREIFVMLGRGYANADIGRQLFISVRTVETHRQRIMRKLDTHTIAELVVIAKRLGIIGWVYGQRIALQS